MVAGLDGGGRDACETLFFMSYLARTLGVRRAKRE